MQGFMLDDDGDVVINNNDIQLVENEELIRQKVRNVLSTNKGEWFLNEDEGINFDNLLGKNNPEELVRAEIEQGIQQVDENFAITEFEMYADKNSRKLTVNFTATNKDMTITDSVLY